MRWSFLLAALSSAVVVGHVKTEVSESKPSESDLICPRPELLRPCECKTYNSSEAYFLCMNIEQPFELKAIFDRLSAERLPNDPFKFRRIELINSPVIESIEFNTTGSALFEIVAILWLFNMTKIHEEAFVGTEHQITALNIHLNVFPPGSRWRWQPNLPSPYNWLGLVRRLKSLNGLRIYTQDSVHPFTQEYHLPDNVFKQHKNLERVVIANKPNRVTFDSRAFAGCRRLSYVALSSVDRVPAEIFADLSPPEPDHPLDHRVFRIRLIMGNITESSFDPRVFAGCCKRPVHLELTKNPIKTLPEAVFRQFFDGHPDNMVNIGKTLVDSRTPENSWWATNDEYKLRVLNFTFKELRTDDESETAFPVEKLGRFNKWKTPDSTASISTTTTRRSRQPDVDESNDPMLMGLDDVDPIF